MRHLSITVVAVLGLAGLAGCDGEQEELGGPGDPCSGQDDCQQDLTCLDDVCQELQPADADSDSDADGDGDGDGDSDADDDGDGGACPSALLCGTPAACCEVGDECVEGQCLPECLSGIRCGETLAVCCGPDMVCLMGHCEDVGEACLDSFDCEEGSFCEPTLGRCLPTPEESDCEIRPAPGPFDPVEEWHWECSIDDPELCEVVSPPVVGDVDGDGFPNVVFPAYWASSGCGGPGALVVLDGRDGSELFVIDDPELRVECSAAAALGDLDADGRAEIVMALAGGGYAAYDDDGMVLWTQRGGSLAAGSYYSAASLADLDGDGTPEVVVGGVVLDAASGEILLDLGTQGKIYGYDALHTVADMDLDGDLEIVTSQGVYQYDETGTPLWFRNDLPPGYTAVASFFGADPPEEVVPEVVVVATGAVRIQSGATGEVLFGPLAIPGGGQGGAPTVADFDGDGRPELSAAGQGQYTVYDTDCWPEGALGECASGRTDGVLWTNETQDLSSSATGSSVFDFEGDGVAEVLYNDECVFRVYDGRDGTTVFSRLNSSRTGIEYPLVVDVDGDNNSEIVLPSNSDGAVRDGCEAPTRGVTALGDTRDRWVRTRPVWNQHAYHITNVRADSTIPAEEERNWTSFNNFRQNSQGEGVFNAPDLTVGLEAGLGGCPTAIVLRARVTNLGTLGVPAGVAVSFFEGEPGSGTLLGTAWTTVPLLPGASDLVALTFEIPEERSEELFDFSAAVDSDETGAGREVECREDNNAASLSDIRCEGIF